MSEALGSDLVEIRHVEHVMGTAVSFNLRVMAQEVSKARVALASARASLHRVDALFSLWKPDSPMSKLRRGEVDLADVPRDIVTVLDRCAEARALTVGWFDPWAMPGGLDPTGLVKGWAAQRALDVLCAAGVDNAMVNAGGDIALAGTASGTPWRIGIRSPESPDQLLGVVAGVAAVATSGLYERGEHLVDPFRGEAISRVAAATVTGPILDLADAVATALVVAGEGGLTFVEALSGYQALVVAHDGTTHKTSGFSFVEEVPTS